MKVIAIALLMTGCVSAKKYRVCSDSVAEAASLIEKCTSVIETCSEMAEFNSVRYNTLVKENDRLAKQLLECK